VRNGSIVLKEAGRKGELVSSKGRLNGSVAVYVENIV